MSKVSRTIVKARFAALAMAVLLCGCEAEQAVVSKHPGFENVDFASSTYKHINNGGIEGDNPMPYNIDAITGATVTVEGPAMESSIPLSMRELENRNEGLYKGVYTDDKGSFAYEGMNLQYLLNSMVDGDNGIILTDSAYSVELKDCNRASIASFTLEDVASADADGRPILLAYGIGKADESMVAPFVFDAENPEERSEGYVEELDNQDGCLKLVYDLDKYGENTEYKTFANVAYVYLREQQEPGFKHSGGGDVYSSSRYTDYIITFRGAALGREVDLTVSQLEALVGYDGDGKLLEGGIGYSDEYSLANNAYWYVNEYEGLDLYKLLIYLGMDDAETMGLAESRKTLVGFVANDGVESQESFSVEALSFPDAFGFYNKNAADLGDGSYAPVNTDLVDSGYPVLLAYGVNGYPYTITKNDDGYLSGLSNSGGPVRVVFGKTQYNHANGSNQVQYLKDVIAGEDVLYNTHKYTDNAAHKALAEQPIQIKIIDDDGSSMMDESMTVGDIEDIIYDEGVADKDKREAMVKDFYQTRATGAASHIENDIFEGVSLPYLLMQTLSLPGTNGKVTFTSVEGTLEVNLADLLNTGYNTELGRDKMAPIIAYAKNGSPLVAGEGSEGYVAEHALNPLLEHEAPAYEVHNAGGPLTVLIPSTSASPEENDFQQLDNLTGITIELQSDKYAHLSDPYEGYIQDNVRFYGDGLEQEMIYTLNDLEGKQTLARTLDFSTPEGERRFRGIAVYELFTEIGVKSNAGDVIVHSADDSTQTYSMADLKKQNFVNHISPDKPQLSAILAYGAGKPGEDPMDGLPLLPNGDDVGYDEAYDNKGGPLRLVMPQQSADEAAVWVDGVVAVEVTANEVDTWSHTMSDIYNEFLDYEFTFTVKNDDSEWSHVFTLGQLEQLTDIIVRDEYSVLDLGECEGLNIWKFIKKFAGDVPGIEEPISINVYANDGYKNDLLSVFYKEGFEQGVADEDGNRKQLILAYAINGSPLVDEENHEGYTGLAGNSAGPLRAVCEGNQGASVKYVNKLVVAIPGSGPIDIQIDESIFTE